MTNIAAQKKIKLNDLPEMLFVKSSNLEAFGYDEDTKDLYVIFKSNAVYAYEGVEKDVVQGLANAVVKEESVGKFFIAAVRSQGYPFRHVGSFEAQS